MENEVKDILDFDGRSLGTHISDVPVEERGWYLEGLVPRNSLIALTGPATEHRQGFLA